MVKLLSYKLCASAHSKPFRSFPVPSVASGRLLSSVRKWYYSLSGFNKIGKHGKAMCA